MSVSVSWLSGNNISLKHWSLALVYHSDNFQAIPANFFDIQSLSNLLVYKACDGVGIVYL